MDFSPRYRNLFELFYGSAKIYGDRPLFGSRVEGKWQWITYSAFRELVDRCRRGLVALGVKPGDAIATISDNRREWAVAAYATYSLGAIHVPIFSNQLEREWKYLLQDSGAKICFAADDGIAAKLRRLQGDLLGLEKIITFETKNDYQDSFEALLARNEPSGEEVKIPDENDVATYIYTADSKGDPVGVMLTHFNLAGNSCAIIQSQYRGLQDGDRSLSFLPWANVFGGCLELNSLIVCGGSIAICDSPDKLFDYLPEVKPTVLFSVPRVWEGLFAETREKIAAKSPFMQAIFNAGMKARAKKSRGQWLTPKDIMALGLRKNLFSDSVKERLGGRLRFADSGGAALSLKCRAFFDDLGLPIYEGYGLTECSGCATSTGPDTYREGSVGLPLSGTTIKLDKNIPAGNEQEGEIIVYGTSLMKGYLHQPELTQAVFTEDGGLRTGDLGRIDADGYVYITGTIKEIYKLANGRYVAPALLEAQLRRSPYISRCLVYGTNRPYNVALIAPDLVLLSAWAKSVGASPFFENLLKDSRLQRLLEDEIGQCSKNFKTYERIRAFAIIDQPFNIADGTITPNLQLNRRAIITKYGDRLDALYQKK
jgi:long-chain acyl-CoA synthetase